MFPPVLLVLLGIFLSIESAVVHQLHRLPSPNQLLLKKGNFIQYLANKERQNQWRISSVDAVGSGGLGDYQDTEYYGNITVGSNNQQFLVILDTGTSNLFIPGISCTMCKTKHKFDSSKSTSLVATNQSFHFKYETENAYGNYVIDTIKMGGIGEQQLAIPNQKFGLADQIPVTIEDGHADGVLGLAFQTIATDNTMPPLINAINQGLMDKPIFTVYMMTRSPFYDSTLETTGPGGQITYGAIDTINCGPVIGSVPLSSATQWQFTINGVSFGNYKNTQKYQVISDTSYMYIAGPRAVLKAIDKEAGGADFSCWKAPVATLDFLIGSNTYSVQPINYMSQDYFDWMKEGKGDCQMNFMPMDSNGFGPQWYLGVPFIRQYCNIYDIGAQKISFAESLQYKTAALTNTYVLNFIMDSASSNLDWYTQENNLISDMANIFALGVGSHKTRFTIGGMSTSYVWGGNATKSADITPAITVIQNSNHPGSIDLGTTLSQFSQNPNSNYAEHEAPPFVIIVAGNPLGKNTNNGIDALKQKGFRFLAVDVSPSGSLTQELSTLFGAANVCATQLTQQTSTKCDQFLMHRVFEME